MKKITVQMIALSSSNGVFNSGEKVRTVKDMKISEEAAASLRKMLETLPAKLDGSHIIDESDLTTAIENGHTELEQIKQQIINCGREFVARDRIAKVDKATMYNMLTASFFEDIESGVYIPALSLEEFKDYKTDTIDEEEGEELEEYIDDIYYNYYKDAYYNWVMKHLMSDYRFVADRIEVDLTEVICGNAHNQFCYFITEVSSK